MRGIFREEYDQSTSTSETKRRKLKLEDTFASSETSTISTSVCLESETGTPTLADNLSVAAPWPVTSTTAATSSTLTSSSDGKLLSETECDKCAINKRKKRSIQKKYNRLQKKYNRLQKNFAQIEKKLKESETEHVTEFEADKETFDIHVASTEQLSESGDDQSKDADGDEDWAFISENSSTCTDDVDVDEDQDSVTRNIVSVDKATPQHEEPKFIVFYSMLLSLFTMFCFKCKKDNPTASMKRNGTMVTVSQNCLNCEDGFVWKSQPLAFGKYPVGNILLSFSILMAGASVSKVLLMFQHMGLSVYTARTYFYHQKKFLFPTVLCYWESYRLKLVNLVKNLKDAVWCGDGRFDSMGHSAKFGTYTMFCCSLMKIVHFEIVQSNETGSSTQTEVEGAKRCFAFLSGLGIGVKEFISDRNRSVAKLIRENFPGTKHFFDIWHVARTITKKMLKASKQSKGCEVIKQWMRGVRNHLYWCLTSTKKGFEDLVEAKWTSFMRHVANKHSSHPDLYFPECAHDKEIEPRQWIKMGTPAYDTLNRLLTNKTLVKDIRKLSPNAQTSSLEGFHATLNHWHPKMLCFTWLGTVCRHILAILHFNENVHREIQTKKDGGEYVKVTWPKFKLGEEVVRRVAVAPTYGYVNDLKELLFHLPEEEMKRKLDEYVTKTPEPMNTQFEERLTKNEAVQRDQLRRELTSINLYPDEEKQDALQASLNVNTGTRAVAQVQNRNIQRTCKTCGKPMRGHKRGECT